MACAFNRGAGGLALLLVMGCGGSQVQKTEEYSGKLPRPERILVYDFAVSPDEVTLTQGLGPDIMNALNGNAQDRQGAQSRSRGRQ